MTEWPVSLRGITEAVVTTQGPEGRWNVAALGLHAGDPVTARTWGDTRTRRNFAREGGGVVQFTRDPVLFVDAALGIREQDSPVVAGVDAWVEVAVERVDGGETDGTRWVEWALAPVDAAVETRRVATINRGFNAVVEATVAASRLDVPAYDAGVLEEQIAFLERVARRCGGPREQDAFDRLNQLVGR